MNEILPWRSHTQLHPSFLFICLLLNHSLYASLHNYNHLKIILWRAHKTKPNSSEYMHTHTHTRTLHHTYTSSHTHTQHKMARFSWKMCRLDILYTNIKAYCTINIHTFYQNTCTPWQLLQSLSAILQEGKACPLHCLVVFACQWLFYGHARNKPCVARGEEVDCLLRCVFVVPRTTETGKRKQRGRAWTGAESKRKWFS